MKCCVAKRILVTAVCAAFAAGVYAPASAVAGSADGRTEAIMKMESIKQSYIASVRMESLRTHQGAAESINAGSPSLWLTRVDAGQVNMVTNRVDKDAARKVNLNGKSYNVNGEMGKWALSNNNSVRFTTDPISGKRIDKSDAVTYADASGRVFYFESDASFKSFLALGERTTAFGYSKPE